MAEVARTLSELKQLAIRDQGILLLRRLSQIFPRGQSFAKQNFLLHQPNGLPDPYGLATGYAGQEAHAVVIHLLGEPWHYLQQNFYIASVQNPLFFEITEKGWKLEKDGAYTPDASVIAALAFMHKDLQGYGHYFREEKREEAVAAAFKRVENRLNEIRDTSKSRSLTGASGVALPHRLFDSRDLNFPFPNLAASNPEARNAYKQSLKNLLASGMGWFRNSFDHEPHNLPDLDDAETIELLFVASYMLRIIDKSLTAAPEASLDEPDGDVAKGSPDSKLARRPTNKSSLSLKPIINFQRLPVPGGGDDELYKLLAGVENDGDVDAPDFQLDVEIPAHFLDGGGHMRRVDRAVRPGCARFQITNKTFQIDHLYPGVSTAYDLLSFNYAIRGQIKRERPELLQEKVTVTVLSGNMKSQKVELTIASLMEKGDAS